MGKMATVYLNTEEEKGLEKYCEEHNCTPYSVLKVALHQLLEEGIVRKVRQSEEISMEAQGKPQAREAVHAPRENAKALLLGLLRESQEKSKTGNGKQ
jgi:hypothetical protein